nr:AAA family ATPase [Ornithinimicrobium sediminis]
MERESSVCPRFFRVVHQHLLTNFLDMDARPPILGIFGPAGEGKTFQVERSIEDCQTEILWINAGDLESDNAGQPARVIVDTLRQASAEIRAGRPVAVVLHDIDTTLGEWKDNTGTVNHQHVLAELMHFADRPNNSRFGGVRVPVLVTGNDAKKMYEPLTRARRMALFHWIPTASEKVAVLRRMLAPVTAQDVSVALVETYPAYPVAFFADLVGLAKEELSRRHPLARIKDMRQLLTPDVRERIVSTVSQGGLLTGEELMGLARTAAEQRQGSLENFLKDASQ